MNWMPGIFWLAIIAICTVASLLERPRRRPMVVRFDYARGSDKVKAVLYRPGHAPVDLKVLGIDANLGIVNIKVPK